MRCNKTLAVIGSLVLGACEQDETLDTEAQTEARAAQTWAAMEASACAGEASGTGANKVPYLATGVWDPFGNFGGEPIGAFLDPGELECPGTEPTGSPPRCPLGSLTHQRGMVIRDRVETVGGIGNAWVTIVINTNLDRMGEGPLWGTFHAALDAGGAWDGVYVGKRALGPSTCDGGLCYVETLRGVGCGEGGPVDGMKLKFREEIFLDLYELNFTSALVGEYW